MKRYNDWLPRLNDYLNTVATVGMEEVNCVTFASGAVQAMTGEDLLKDIGRGTPKEQQKQALKLGYKSFTDFLEMHMEEIEPGFAQVGDVAVAKDLDGNPALGIVIGAYIKALDTDGYPVSVDLELAEKVFRP